MPRPRSCWCLLYGSLVLATAPGCLSFHSYRPVPILVRDAETKEPIPNAQVKLWYPINTYLTPPQDAAGLTDAAGIAHLQAAPYGEGIMISVKAPRYLTEDRNISSQVVEKIEPEHWYQKGGPRPPGLVIEMYAEPRPALELVVPIGYRGMVRVKLHIKDDAPWPARQRIFPCTANSAGIAEVELAPTLRRFYPLDVHAKFADGTILKPDAGPSQIGLRFLRSQDNEQVFVVGTSSEYEYVRSLTQAESREQRGSGGGGGGRGGGMRHRHGGGSDQK